MGDYQKRQERWHYDCGGTARASRDASSSSARRTATRGPATRPCATASPSYRREPAAGLLMPKDLFANERTFIKWVHVAVILVSFGSTAFAFADAGARFISPAARFRAACYGGMLCVGASVLACYALLTYRWRARHILAKDQPEWGDPQGPLLVTFVVVFMLLSAWVAEMKVYLTP